MPTTRLPDDPDVESLRSRAKQLLRAMREGEPRAVSLVAEHYGALSGTPRLHIAQLVLARMYGFASWPRLVAHVHLVHQLAVSPEPDTDDDTDADRFLRLACLTYSDKDGPGRWAAARALLAERPDIREAFPVAVVNADLDRVRSELQRDPTLAVRACGPWNREPLVYLAYARHDPDLSEAAVLGTASMLLDFGADPNAGFLWHGLHPPFTVLTGVFGQGEQGATSQPPHRHERALARLLLESGADPNDGQTLYNRMFEPDDSHLRLLFAYGLGSGDGGPWRARLGAAQESPEQMVRQQLAWATTHRMTERVRLLAQHGVELSAPLADGRTPVQLALAVGHQDMASLLRSLGADDSAVSPVDRYVAAALEGDSTAVGRLESQDPGLRVLARTRHPALVLRAANNGNAEAVRLLADLGFDINALGRRDQPIDEPWESALHASAHRGDSAMVALLLELGADTGVRDARFDATPAEWARHGGHEEVAQVIDAAAAG